MRASLITYQKLHAQNFEKSAKRHISLNSLLTDAVVLCCVLCVVRECETNSGQEFQFCMQQSSTKIFDHQLKNKKWSRAVIEGIHDFVR